MSGTRVRTQKPPTHALELAPTDVGTVAELGEEALKSHRPRIVLAILEFKRQRVGVASEAGIPVLYGLPLGHGASLARLPLGVEATVNADALRHCDSTTSDGRLPDRVEWLDSKRVSSLPGTPGDGPASFTPTAPDVAAAAVARTLVEAYARREFLNGRKEAE